VEKASSPKKDKEDQMAALKAQVDAKDAELKLAQAEARQAAQEAVGLTRDLQESQGFAEKALGAAEDEAEQAAEALQQTVTALAKKNEELTKENAGLVKQLGELPNQAPRLPATRPRQRKAPTPPAGPSNAALAKKNAELLKENAEQAHQLDQLAKQFRTLLAKAQQPAPPAAGSSPAGRRPSGRDQRADAAAWRDRAEACQLAAQQSDRWAKNAEVALARAAQVHEINVARMLHSSYAGDSGVGDGSGGGSFALCLKDFDGSDATGQKVDAAMPLVANDLVYVVQRFKDGWWQGERWPSGEGGTGWMKTSGYFPVQCVDEAAADVGDAMAATVGGGGKGARARAKARALKQASQAQALFPFQGQYEGDLVFHAGDSVRVLRPSSQGSGWLVGEAHGVIGTFPEAYVQPRPIGTFPEGKGQGQDEVEEEEVGLEEAEVLLEEEAEEVEEEEDVPQFYRKQANQLAAHRNKIDKGSRRLH
jgi:hypothetical protein